MAGRCQRLSVTGVTSADDNKRLFLNLAGLGVRRIVKGIVVPTPADGGCAYQALTDAVLAHFRPATNTTSERYKFRQLRQQESESVTSFVGRLREAADRCVNLRPLPWTRSTMAKSVIS